MPDQPKGPWGLSRNDIISIIGAIFSGIAMLITTCNMHEIDRGNRTLRHVEAQQDTQLQKTQDIAIEIGNVQQRAEVIDHKASLIESKLRK